MKKADIVFWIGAICINQDDLAERNSQVNLMYAIYSGAKVVKAWIDEADANSDAAIDTIEKWTVNMKKLSHVDNVIKYITRQAEKRKFYYKLDDISQESVVDPLKAFLFRLYWKRMWIIQELVLAPNASVGYTARGKCRDK